MHARNRLPASSARLPVAMDELLENRRLLAGHMPAWSDGDALRVDAGTYMPLRQTPPAMFGWGLGRLNVFLVVAVQAADATAGLSAPTASVSSSGVAAIASSTGNATSAGNAAGATRAIMSAERFSPVFTNAAQPNASADDVNGVIDAMPTAPVAKGQDHKAVAIDVGPKAVLPPVKIVNPNGPAATAGPTLTYAAVGRPLFAREQMPAQSRRAIEATEAQSDEPVVIADATGEPTVATASIAPISIDPLGQPLWQRVAAMAAAGLLIVANTVVRRRARRAAAVGVRR